MTVKQLSVFLENRSGALTKVLECLESSKVNIIASSIADTAEYGIFRFICDDTDKAFSALQASGVAVSLCDVFMVDPAELPGGASAVVGAFANAGISIAYMYSFLLDGKGIMIFRTDNIEKAASIYEKIVAGR